MIVKLIEDKIQGGKEAINEIYNMGYYGRPKGNTLELTLVEAAYLLYRKKIDIELDKHILEFADFIKIASRRQPYFELKYIVYKDLRERGFYVQPSVVDFRVYPRGGHPGKTPAKSFVYVRSERIPMPLRDLIKPLNSTSNVRKQMILAIVDEESDITFYEIKKVEPKGNMEMLYPHITTDATILHDRVIVWESSSSNTLYEQGFYGKLLDLEHLQLSLVESAYLLENNIIKVHDRETGDLLNFEEFSKRASEIEPEFVGKYKVYEDLRNRHLVPKTGFKFGTHFRVYSQARPPKKIPHSENLVHTIPQDYEFALPVMSRAVRLANSVRKRMLFAVQSEKTVEYIDIGRIKM
ncbi:MAG: tRNA-intron lyase [Methanosarcinaceae archaeon]|nr:tRNA-intron lyase [Methanosarcinaceae archaeon]